MFNWRRRKPLSLRVRFLLATAAVVLTMSLSYGMVAVIGYVVSFDKNTYRVLRSESNLFFTLSQWNDGKLSIVQPERMTLNFPALVFIYDDNGKLLWQQRDVPDIRSKIRREWLNKSDFYEIDTNNHTSREVLGNDRVAQNKLTAYDDDGNDTFTHSVAVNRYEATSTLPALTIVVVDSIPQELQHSDVVWSWFSYVLLANLLLIIPLLWLAAHWSLRPIGALAAQVRELEAGTRETLNPAPPQELKGLVRNLNLLLDNERQRYTRYRTTLSDLTHSLKTPLAVLQTTLRSLRGGRNLSIEQAEPIMLEQISRISQQIGYYLHRASMQADHHALKRDVHSVPALLDGLCSALNKVYQRKGVVLTLDISPEVIFVGEQNDFMEVMGNVLDNACKYCLEFVEISVQQTEKTLLLIVEDDGPGIPENKRDLIFIRGQRADTLRPGQGLGLSLARDIMEQYAGDIHASTSQLGGARMAVEFQRQEILHKHE
ncbi:two-component system sensor histidine kinase PhoQ [Erwinia persicina]|uniref:histidine kinase n=1 Tax=Erwinia persicina TaxID=55211 RepID=A0A354A8W9_9GAMM|nr:two-component system sensor histidine kinase PhoQ [Erwinia persicina]AXU95536.1 two-component system sensor histidine kinase PhoQ [Erwinia persicina]MBC3945781.1 two-component system sensor histidine kinase PhoQ [Erwinia persicina]MBD8108592.1 two-component system sensor histidine kinase PhoQ [Erwinia persicina]MBD8166092.1 two-component system sensor histidine kinase PhoQ [Erwinia persicina]MBD8211740.1 two-component system sensor histidine kinase PhoQ [Erwinia persicina]